MSHGDLDAQTDEMISALPQKNLKSHFLSLQAVLKNQVRIFQETCSAECSTVQGSSSPSARFLYRYGWPWCYSMVSDMSQSPQGVLKKRNRSNSRQRRHRRAVSCRGHDFLCTSSSGYLHGIPARKAWTNNEGCRFQRSVARPISVWYEFS